MDISAEFIERIVFSGNSVMSEQREQQIESLEDVKLKIPDAKISGDPRNFFGIAFRISSEEMDFFRSFDVLQVKGGGCIIQSSWREAGRPSLSMDYEPGLMLRETEYTDVSGKMCKGFVVVARPWWKRLLDSIFGG